MCSIITFSFGLLALVGCDYFLIKTSILAVPGGLTWYHIHTAHS